MNKPLDELAARRQLRELQTQWQQTLDHDVATLDADVVARLASARKRALKASAGTRRSQHLRWLTPALAALLLVGLWIPKNMRDVPGSLQQMPLQQATPQLELSDNQAWQEDTELLDELEFYTWLEVETGHAS